MNDTQEKVESGENKTSNSVLYFIGWIFVVLSIAYWITNQENNSSYYNKSNWFID